MSRVVPLSFLCLTTAACQYLPWYQEGPPPSGCDVRQAFHPDADGDGAGADDIVYLGCVAPGGYVIEGGDCDDADPATTACPDTGDTQAPGDTGDTARGGA